MYTIRKMCSNRNEDLKETFGDDEYLFFCLFRFNYVPKNRADKKKSIF